MKILFFTKSKPYTLKILKDLLAKGHQVTVVCKSYESFKNSEMEQYCQNNGVVVWENDELYLKDNLVKLSSYDLGISNTYGRLIKKEVIEALKGRIFNVHAAPLPDYRGMFTYNWALYNRECEWGVTAHYVNEVFDNGNIIRIDKFPLDSKKIIVKELEQVCQKIAYEMTMEIVEEFFCGRQPIGISQKEEGRYYSRADFEKLKLIRITDSAEEIERKIHACWCPPYEGAYLLMDGKKFYLMTEREMAEGE